VSHLAAHAFHFLRQPIAGREQAEQPG